MLACVSVPALPLQWVLQRNPSWRSDPVVVVEKDDPAARILWLNQQARTVAIRRGMRFGEARCLAARLRAAVVPEAAITQTTTALWHALLNFSPRVEVASAQPGVFWIDPTGMMRLFGNIQHWAERVHAAIAAQALLAAVAVGFNRTLTYAIARSQLGVCVLDEPARERALAHAIALTQLDLPPTLCEALAALGIDTLGEVLALPVGELRQRFGAEIADLHDVASGTVNVPLRADLPRPPARVVVDIEPAEADHARLLFLIKPGLQQLLAQLRARCQAMVALRLWLHLDHYHHHHHQKKTQPHEQHLSTAAPTLDDQQVIELIRLRLAAIALPAAVEQVVLEADAVTTSAAQIHLLDTPGRDLDAAARALARIRAAFGSASVTRAYLKPAILPEGRFGWEPIERVQCPRPHNQPLICQVALATPDSGLLPEMARIERLPLIRQVLARPQPLPLRSRHDSAAWPYLAPDEQFEAGLGPLHNVCGPFRVSGGWWARPVERDYYYVETGQNDILWIYYDRPRRRWFQHGQID